METKFDKSSVVRQPNALRIPKPSVLGKPTPFQTLLRGKVSKRQKSVTKTNVLEGLLKPVTTQILPQTANQAVRNTNVIRPGMYRIDTRTTHTRAPQLPQTSRNTNPRVSTSTGDSGFELTAFSYADHAGYIDTRKSTSGGIHVLGDRVAMSKKQACIAMSSVEEEYVALSASFDHVMWMRTQLKDYGFDYNKIPLSECQLADMFTKSLPQDRLEYLVRQIRMRCLTPAELEVLTNETA
ncbi:hypothetical protein Tco_0038838 [Tanacetum coccineum]